MPVEQLMLQIQDFLEDMTSNNSNSEKQIRFEELDTELRDPKKVVGEFFDENGDQDEVSGDLLSTYSFETEEIYNWSVDLYSILEQNSLERHFDELKNLLEEMLDNDSRSWLVQKKKADYESDYQDNLVEDDSLESDKNDFDNNSILFFQEGKFYMLDQFVE